MTEGEIIRARIAELQRMIAALQAALRIKEIETATAILHRETKGAANQ
ncbi:hypothetical protein [Bradyrhizobium septentrionale]|uniref:Uncharacterized protein n=1 Tax=Bradyrhizobium septentrionale TaxID=1404411 RepID=A0A973W5G8_9BRAD|nr:hypothetical protein [Bradyrhizobium septentrionale]UGY16332.1 hypothetical protein HAP48_0049045 [Bradyrhizobium septentrionale]UGY24675.1 hypothetical protein HU675_0043390 [Bradyrhizobium septentrionale]